jgi:ankyrin repeat protein
MSSASNNENAEVLTILRRAGADVNATDRAGKTPLIWAAEANRV